MYGPNLRQGQGAKKWFATLDPGGFKLRDYHEGLLTSFGFVQIMGMPSARRLETVYVGLRAVPDMKKHTNREIVHASKPQEEKVIVEARKLLYSRQRINIDKFISDLGRVDKIIDA
jgi:hypothetical protein